MNISLTFDNGPHPATTPQVLDILARQEVKASFFMLGRNLMAPEGRELAEAVHRQGHRIGNHTFSHRMFGTMDDPGEAIGEIDRTQALLEGLVDDDRLFRPAGGGGRLGPEIMSRTAYDHLIANGYSCILWNSVPRDWEDTAGWAKTALSAIPRTDWSVIVLHDLPTGAMDHLESFIEQARALGGVFTQDFPTECTPLWRGDKRLPMDMIEVSTRPI